mgnify:CR=1 FL=1
MATKKTKNSGTQRTTKVIVSSKKKGLSGKQWGIIGIVGAIVVGVGAYLVVQTATTNASSCVSKTFSQGSNGSCVTYIQTLLNYKIGKNSPNISKVAVDGAYGAKTKSAVSAFQKYWKLNTNGTVNKQTWNSLCSAQMGYTDGKGSHGVWTSKSALAAAKSAGCSVSNDVVR